MTALRLFRLTDFRFLNFFAVWASPIEETER